MALILGSWWRQRAYSPHPSIYQVKEMSLIRNTIMECQVCGEWEWGRLWMVSLCSPPQGFSLHFW